MSTKIQWTDEVWNPVIGCARVSEGCRNCYAERMAARQVNMGSEGYAEVSNGNVGKPRWTGRVRLMPGRLDQPLRWRKPRRVFVNSMSDLFHEGVPDEFIAAVFGVMAASPRHTFMVLTKRPERMARWFGWLRDNDWPDRPGASLPSSYGLALSDGTSASFSYHADRMWSLYMDRGWVPSGGDVGPGWPLRNVWIGVSVEDQGTYDERRRDLLDCPAAVHWLSYEPALGHIDFGADLHRLDWIVVGGESGPGARPFDVQWARDTVAACEAAGVPVFVKQLGANLIDGPLHSLRRATKRDDPAKWPEDLRIREWPEVPR